MKINKKYPRDIEDQLSIRCIIDIQYITTKKFYLFQLIFFVVTWVCPFFYQTFKDSVDLFDPLTQKYKDEATIMRLTDNGTIEIYVCALIMMGSSIVQGILFLLEFMDSVIQNQNITKFLFEPLNIIEIGIFLTNVLYYIQRIQYPQDSEIQLYQIKR